VHSFETSKSIPLPFLCSDRDANLIGRVAGLIQREYFILSVKSNRIFILLMGEVLVRVVLMGHARAI
jgi:hypothetical protein